MTDQDIIWLVEGLGCMLAGGLVVAIVLWWTDHLR